MAEAWSEGVAERRGRKVWSENLLLVSSPIRLSLQVPWCAKSQIFMLESSTLVRQDSQPLTKLLEANSI